MVKVEELNPGLMETLPTFNRAVWGFPEDRGFLSWMFLNSPDTTVYVAHDAGRWLACLGVFNRTYLMGGEPVECGETYAWARLPQHRGGGLGVKVMKAIMERGRPLVALGGSADTLNYMPRMGFEVLGSGPALNLPLSPRLIDVEPSFSHMSGPKRLLVKVGLTMLAPLLRPRARTGASLRNVPLSVLEQTTLSMAPERGLQAMYDEAFFQWLNGYPEVGTFLPFRFMRDETLVGWAFARVSEEAPGYTAGRLLEFKFVPGTTAADHKAMLSAVCAAVAGLGAVIIRSLTTCPDTNRALRSLRFMSKMDLPAMVYPAGRKLATEPLRLNSLRADGALLPLPSRLQLAS